MHADGCVVTYHDHCVTLSLYMGHIIGRGTGRLNTLQFLHLSALIKLTVSSSAPDMGHC